MFLATKEKCSVLSDYFSSCKPKIIALMLVTAWTGMVLASKNNALLLSVDAFLNIDFISVFIFASLGIACVAASAAIVNHIVDRKLDVVMLRTQQRAIASGRISIKNALIFSCVLGTVGSIILICKVNILTAVLSLITLFSYALFYTLILKPNTPQNIVIGGITGAMPPLLGWAAISNSIHPHAWLLVLIIFTWTPPHFWSLAIYKREEYKKTALPMLPLTHGIPFTKLCIVLYTILLFIVSLLPYLT